MVAGTVAMQASKWSRSASGGADYRRSSPPSVVSPRSGELSLPENLLSGLIPRKISCGQDNILGPSSILRLALACSPFLPLVLWGPPASDKTSIAQSIASSWPHHFVFLSAVTAGVKDVRSVIDDALRDRSHCQTILFVDEIHCFSKAEQDSFLPGIEDGSIIFISATIAKPSFHLTTPLLSRSRVLSLHPLNPDHIASLLRRDG
ncbi:hypothetical protein J5N97_025106 [Dioscorea zingiberensis]|uniref:ATPase AAA-type core domain-containing protein n=1 Tax=Dioscorea zingiberensis TaxID=325984 RepID=A0A9D5C8P8_9LILI|nr:hypothetical protein J5N97_025106 [Dioscorea zingiberensis]